MSKNIDPTFDFSNSTGNDCYLPGPSKDTPIKVRGRSGTTNKILKSAKKDKDNKKDRIKYRKFSSIIPSSYKNIQNRAESHSEIIQDIDLSDSINCESSDDIVNNNLISIDKVHSKDSNGQIEVHSPMSSSSVGTLAVSPEEIALLQTPTDHNNNDSYGPGDFISLKSDTEFISSNISKQRAQNFQDDIDLCDIKALQFRKMSNIDNQLNKKSQRTNSDSALSPIGVKILPIDVHSTYIYGTKNARTSLPSASEKPTDVHIITPSKKKTQKVANTTNVVKNYDRIPYKPLPIKEFYVRSQKGKLPHYEPKNNQDRYLIQVDSNTNSVLLMILDGHGEYGERISDYIKRNFASLLFSNKLFPTNVALALKNSIVHMHKIILDTQNEICDLSGTTLVCCVVRDDILYAANVGDSRLSIVSEDDKLMIEQVTVDHKLDMPTEITNINYDIAEIIEISVGNDKISRLFAKNSPGPGLAMSRSLGDKYAHELGISFEPELFTRKLDRKREKYILLSSDGLTEFLPDDEICNIFNRNDYLYDTLDDLINVSTERWEDNGDTIDDITIIIATL